MIRPSHFARIHHRKLEFLQANSLPITGLMAVNGFEQNDKKWVPMGVA